MVLGAQLAANMSDNSAASQYLSVAKLIEAVLIFSSPAFICLWFQEYLELLFF